MKTTITLTREDGAEISFSPPSVSQSFTLSFPRGMALNDAARDPVRATMKAEAERVTALFNGARAEIEIETTRATHYRDEWQRVTRELETTRAALERIAEMTCDGTGRNFDEWGEAACFTDCVRIASDCLASVKGRAS